MALFEFELKNINEIALWGEAPNLELHWFGLTDSFYHLNVQGKELFRYSNEMLNWWSKRYPNETQNVYVDYQVARLYEDVLTILPDIMQPIPQEVYEFVNSHDAHQKFIKQIKMLEENSNNEDELWDLLQNAISWLSCRSLDSSHLVAGPAIWFLRYHDDIIIRWNNENKEIDGIQPWSEIKGETKYTIQDFMSEVELFHNRLITKMNSRVGKIIHEAPLPHVNIDKKCLSEDHKLRQVFYDKALMNQPSINNWDPVALAIRELFR